MQPPIPSREEPTAEPGPRQWWFSPAGNAPQRQGAEAGEDQPSLTLPSVSLPKGGGAIKGIDEKLAVEQATGTASLSVGVFVSRGRSGFQPSLNLHYDSGSGNGPYGLGFGLAVPEITRKTSRGLPRYDDALDSDVFILSGSEDLVPLLVEGKPAPEPQRSVAGRTFNVRAYRPRVESAFARIERWQDAASGEVHWRTISPDNVTSLFGQDASSRIADPADPTRVFTWLLDLSFDDRGNAISYLYKPEDDAGVAVAANEANRVVTANRYPKRVRYGNRRPYAGTLPEDDEWCFELVLDYGEHDLETPTPAETEPWTCRGDPFSSYRSTFEVRTYRRCRRLLMFHNFAAREAPQWTLVRSTDLEYVPAPSPGSAGALLPSYTLLASVTQTGWVPDGEGGYATEALPAIDLEYQTLQVDQTQHFADELTTQNLTAAGARWIDVNGEGVKGLLTEDEHAWYYKRNVSTWNPTGGPPAARLEPLTVLAEKPAVAGLALTDLNGDGNLCAVKLTPPDAGWFEYEPDAGWTPYRELQTTASIAWESADVRMMDLTGDGLADVLICEDDAFGWHEWLVETGFAAAARVPKPSDEERGPALVFAEPTACIFLADMSGDGLTDLVRIRSGEVCYWPNLGYGRFGAKVAMDASPTFDNPDRFDARRIRLADVDGSGTADLFYLAEQTTIYFNQSGNSWTAPQALPQAPRFDNDVEIEVLDLLGTGMACLVWGSALPGDVEEPLRYIDLTASQKPFLLTAVKNNLGATRTLTYAPSTRFYLQDRAAGRPWLTRLPFPVHVVERLETQDTVSGTSYTTQYSYHHGYYDGVEREFRGFASVESIDTDAVPGPSGIGDFTDPPTVKEGQFELPPVLTRTWFHTGAFFGWGDIAAHLQLEYWAGDAKAPQLAPTVLPTEASGEDLREASRALRGRALREEVYALDGSLLAANPYLTREHRYEVRMLQPPAGTQYGSFYAWDLEALACQYERDPTDPRIGHTLTLAVDEWGNVTQQATVSYARRATSASFTEQEVTWVHYVQSDFTQIVDGGLYPDDYRVGVPVETRKYQLTGAALAAGQLYDPTTLAPLAAGAAEIAYEATPTSGVQRRLCARQRTYYRSDDLASRLALGAVEALAIVDATYTERYTPGLLANVYGGALEPATLSAEGALVDLDGDGAQWVPSLRLFYSSDPTTPNASFAAEHFFLPQCSLDAWGNKSSVTYDEFELLPVATEDAVGNVTRVENNYRVMGPWLSTDSNLNRNGVRYNALGMVLATAAMGKLLADGNDEGDTLDTSTDEPSPSDDPTTKVAYALSAYSHWASEAAPDPDHPTPVSVQSLRRVRHKDPATPWLQTFAYMDGLGRIALTKSQAEPGPAPQWTASGTLVKDPETGGLALAETQSRWLGSGRVVYDNKGNTVKSYEPFFDSNADYVVEAELAAWGVTAITRRDPLGRAIRVDNPDGSFRTFEFDPWQTATYDENDTVLESDWYHARAGGALGEAQQNAANKAAAHANTPATADLDPLGRTFQATVDNGPFGKYTTVFTLDIDDNQLLVTDALGRTAFTRVYDMTGAEIESSSIDAGERRLLLDAGGQPLQAWDSRGFLASFEYDALRRPTKLFVALETDPGARRLAEELVYGETLGFGPSEAPAKNLCGIAYRRRDQAGVALTDERDFQGNVTSATRELLAGSAYDTEVDWSEPQPTPEHHTTTTGYDALNRPITARTPDASVTATSFNERSLVSGIEVQVRGATAAEFVTAVSYDEKGQRKSIIYGNGASATYTYDPDTFRLVELVSTRPEGPNPLQDLSYAYDPVGNVTSLADSAQQTNFYDNQVVEADAGYTYDPIYRLIAATGREHIGQTTSEPVGPNDAARMGFALPLANDAQAMRRYTEEYEYDSVGNLTKLEHKANGSTWTRTYEYPASNNRLQSSAAGGVTEPYEYDAHGNITSMPHLSLLEWDWKDELRASATQRVNEGTPETTYYSYDGTGQRIVKATYGEGGKLVSRRVYLGNYELYQTYEDGSTVALERETLHVGDGAQRISLVETVSYEKSNDALRPTPLVRYQLANQLGSALIELDGEAARLTYEEYYPYGATSYQAGRSQAEAGLKRYRYTGKERDAENAFYYHGARYYAPWLGRWISCDPSGPIDALNLYLYARANPIGRSDPTGSQSTDDNPPKTGQTGSGKTGAGQTGSGEAAGGSQGGDSGGDQPQMSMPLLGLTNPAFQAQYPVLTLRTEFLSVLGFQPPTDKGGALVLPSFSQTVSVSDRLSEKLEVSVLGAAGTSTGSLGLGLHYGPPSPDGNNVVTGWGTWATLSQVWGLAPPTGPLVPPGWSFNPTLNAFEAFSVQVPNKYGFDINAGAQVSRWGQIVGVPVAGFFAPFGGVNLFVNLSNYTVLNLEGVASWNLGLGGRQDIAGAGGVPQSLTWTVGLGLQHIFPHSDWGIGVEAYGGNEALSNITNDAGGTSVWQAGLRFDFGAINAHRASQEHP